MLVGNDLGVAREMIEESRRYLLAKLDYDVDIFTDSPTLDTGPRRERP